MLGELAAAEARLLQSDAGRGAGGAGGSPAVGGERRGGEAGGRGKRGSDEDSVSWSQTMEELGLGALLAA